LFVKLRHYTPTYSFSYLFFSSEEVPAPFPMFRRDKRPSPLWWLVETLFLRWFPSSPLLSMGVTCNGSFFEPSCFSGNLTICPLTHRKVTLLEFFFRFFPRCFLFAAIFLPFSPVEWQSTWLLDFHFTASPHLFEIPPFFLSSVSLPFQYFDYRLNFA